jgi:hypothetical protein
MQSENERARLPRRVPAKYEPPRVEQVMGPRDLEREVLYAGTAKLSNAPPQ